MDDRIFIDISTIEAKTIAIAANKTKLYGVMIFDRELTPTEIKKLHLKQRPPSQQKVDIIETQKDFSQIQITGSLGSG